MHVRKISQNIFNLTEKFSPGDSVTYSQPILAPMIFFMYDRLKDTDKKNYQLAGGCCRRNIAHIAEMEKDWQADYR